MKSFTAGPAKYISFILALCMFFVLVGCKKEERVFKTEFPLTQEAVTSAMETAGISGYISEDETDSYQEGHILYVLRSSDETYVEGGNDRLIASISSADVKDGRVLYTTFDSSVESNQLSWEEWKQQITFAALLYGGFENEEELYLALCENELPAGETSCAWEVQLPEGYCRVSYSYRSHNTYNDEGFMVKNQSAYLTVNIFESEELYQELKPKK